MSMSLKELQDNFKAYILNQNTDILNAIATDHANAVERIDIYKKGYALRLLEILEKDFPTFRGIVGHEVFDKMGRDYIDTYPSDHFSICVFSRHFSKYLLEANYEPHMSELVAFEWALSCVLDAADAPHIGLAELGTIAPESWPDVQFEFHPSVKIQSFFFNAPQIIYAHMLAQETIPEVARDDIPSHWIIWRSNLSSYFESVTPQQVWMINAINEGKTFAELCEGLCQWFTEEEVAQYAAGSLQNWLSKGLISAVKIKSLVCSELS